MKINITLFLIFTSFVSFSQEKKRIDHTVYDEWKSISSVNQSPTGKIIAYEIKPLKGDGLLYVRSTESDKVRSFSRGNRAQINYNEQFVTFFIAPQHDTIRKLKLKKVKKDKLPKDTLAIYFPENDSLLTIPNIKSYSVANEGDWLAYLSFKNERPNCKQKKCRFFKKKKGCLKSETTGKTLYLLHPISGRKIQIDEVVDYHIDKWGKQLIYVKSRKGESDTLSLHEFEIATRQENKLIDRQLSIKSIQFDESNKQLLFLHSTDTNKLKNFSLSYWNMDMNESWIIVDSTTSGMPQGHNISNYFQPYFSQNGKKIILGTNKRVTQEAEDTLLENEKAKVDVWSSYDLRIQPQQLAEKRRDERKAFRSIYDIENKKFTQLGSEEISQIRINSKAKNINKVLGYSAIPYQRFNTWEYPWKEDIYLINIKDETEELILEGQAFPSDLSPSGDYFVWYNGLDSTWNAKNTVSKETSNLTQNLDALFASDVNGNTFTPDPEGYSGWTLINDVEFFIANSRYDIWAICPSDPSKTYSVTNQEGKKDKNTLRLNRFDQDSTYLSLEESIIHGVDFQTKSEAYYQLIPSANRFILEEKIRSNHKFVYISKAEKTDQILFRRMNFQDYSDLELSDLNFTSPKKITQANPQQEEYNWGTVELVNWTSFKGINLRGLLYKPEDFDSTKSYPMITYYYERNSSNLHNHYTPKPTASIVYPTEYVSNGYIIFIPDVDYIPGYPAASAYDCIVSGTDHLTQNNTWIDTNRLGLQGQSWGGYQTAQLITMTGKYSAAMAGAPVSNMFSAYGGVRWRSGLSRMFQYEHGQSRIGYTIWEKPSLYIENSPIFGLNNVSTPLLIMHNDGDGSVPWYQGIELYMGLRRLDQPVWLLNYNGDEHNLLRTANRKDLSIRMRQFFDYYLLDYPIPAWMENGVPAVDKGKDYGLEFKKSK